MVERYGTPRVALAWLYDDVCAGNGRLKQVFIHCAPIAVVAIYGAHVVEKTIYQLLAVIPFSGIFSKMKHPGAISGVDRTEHSHC